MDQDLRRRVEAWIEQDPDPAARAELQALVDDDDVAELVDRFDGRLVFGTAGIRGVVAAGPNRLNRAVAIQTAAGLAAHVHATSGSDGEVVVGNDARPDSPMFAQDIARVLVAAGLRVALFDRPVPTPIVAYAALARGAAAAVVVTASHNPRADNGIKVYAGNGIQIIPPTDQQIADAIDRAGPAADIARTDGDLAEVVTLLGDAALQDYVQAIVAARSRAVDPSDLRVVATALHGVGGAPLVAVLAAVGAKVEQVAEQAVPDGTFPTVAFPNPEEPGAMDLVLELARARGADLALANDPDADRLAVALPDSDGTFHALTGNQLGVLLADALLEASTASRPVVASSIVSTPQLAAVAALHGARHEVTLTGFKWIWTALLAAQDEGWTPVIGFEEALGYSVGEVVRDKDGLSAALAVIDLAAFEQGRGRTLLDRLDDLARTTGQWVGVQESVRLDGPDADDRLASAFAELRTRPPLQLAGYAVLAVRDHQVADPTRPRWLGTQNLLEFTLAGADGNETGRALLRPSGTEPKVKAYVDLRMEAAPDPAPRADESVLGDQARAVARDLLEACGLV